MKLLRSTLASLVLCTSLALAGCGGGDGGDDNNPAVDPITQDDIADVGDLIQQDPDAAAAAEMIGDPATLLAEGKKQAEKARSDVAAVIDFFKQVTAGEPAKSGARADGKAFAHWEKEIQGQMIGATVIRAEVGRLHYLVAVKAADGTKKPLLRGVFIKKGPKTGGGKFHLNLTNVSDTFNAPGADGSVHFWFANHKGDKRARRIVYADVVRRDDPNKQKINFGADLVRLVGVGGRFRSIGIGDIIPELPGPEAIGLRILWKAGAGGRAAAAVAALNPPKLLGTAFECWDAGGMRSAYMDDNTMNDAMNPNEGDVKDATKCGGLQEEMPPAEGDVNVDGMDADPEADSLFTESGASDIPDSEVDAVDDAGI